MSAPDQTPDTRLVPCPECDGTGLLHDYSSPDPQQHWNSTCTRCWETGLIDITEEAA